MNLEDLDREVKEDIEDQSLEILALVKDEIIVIGGWAVRAIWALDIIVIPWTWTVWPIRTVSNRWEINSNP
jgi:hypothetical protein